MRDLSCRRQYGFCPKSCSNFDTKNRFSGDFLDFTRRGRYNKTGKGRGRTENGLSAHTKTKEDELMKEIELTAENFAEEVDRSPVPVLVDFWAPWCNPCRRFAPIIAEVAEEYEGKIKVCKCNVDENAGVREKFGIMSIPTVIVFDGGKEVNRVIGLMPKDELVEALGL